MFLIIYLAGKKIDKSSSFFLMQGDFSILWHIKGSFKVRYGFIKVYRLCIWGL
jgi:hypothetical protein